MNSDERVAEVHQLCKDIEVFLLDTPDWGKVSRAANRMLTLATEEASPAPSEPTEAHIRELYERLIDSNNAFNAAYTLQEHYKHQLDELRSHLPTSEEVDAVLQWLDSSLSRLEGIPLPARAEQVRDLVKSGQTKLQAFLKQE